MVVLEEGSMLTTGHNQYLQPDYLSPLPMTVSILKYFRIKKLMNINLVLKKKFAYFCNIFEIG